jgi:hypothetical protein
MGNDANETPAIDPEIQSMLDAAGTKHGKAYAWACMSVAYDGYVASKIERLAGEHMAPELSTQIQVWANHLAWQRLEAEARAQGVPWTELARDASHFQVDFHFLATPQPKGVQ